MFTYLFDGSFGEYFLFYGLADLFIYLWLEGTGPTCPRLFPLLHPEFGTRFAPSVHRDISLQNWFSYSLFPLDEKGCYFRCRSLTYHLASFFFPVRRLLWTTVCPVYPFFIHSATECKHLLAFILTWICYFGREELTYITIPLFSGQPLAAC